MQTIYCNIANLLKIESARHLRNLAVERSGSALSDEDVLESIIEIIDTSCRDFDGYIKGHMEVPLEPTIINLTGTITVANDVRDVVGVGTLFLTELADGDWIFPDNNENAIVVVKNITDNTHLKLTTGWIGIDVVAADISQYVHGVPLEVMRLCRDHTAFNLWARRGRHEDQNPHLGREQMFRKIVRDIQRGHYRFDQDDQGLVEAKPTEYDTEAETAFTDTAMTGFMADFP